jgi:hypothetical protein
MRVRLEQFVEQDYESIPFSTSRPMSKMAYGIRGLMEDRATKGDMHTTDATSTLFSASGFGANSSSPRLPT